MAKRTFLVGVGVALLLGACAWRIYALVAAGGLSQAATDQATLTVTVGTARGTIYDRDLTPLTNTGQRWMAAIAPFPETLSALSRALPGEKLRQLLGRLQSGKPVVTPLTEPVTPTRGLTRIKLPVRYGEKVLAPHVVGYVDDTGAGVTGAELIFDKALAAHTGRAEVTYSVDATGRPLEGMNPTVTDTLSAATGGVALTLDSDIQRMTEQVLAEHVTRGAAVVLDPFTGRILAMASAPTYQPTDVAAALDDENAPLLNRALLNYNCGSVFKVVVTAAALEAGLSPDTVFACEGGLTVGSLFFHCHYILGHGDLTMREAFAKSCNPYYIQLGQAVGPERVYAMATAFGFDRALTLAEGWQTARAVLPSLEEIQASAATFANLSFGQGNLLATPVHIAGLAAATVNDGVLCRPTLLLGEVDETGTLRKAELAAPQKVFSASTAAILRDMMRTTMVDGTGEKGQPFHLGAGAKTGTAETGWYEDGVEVVQHWFTGFYPSEDPRYVIVTLAENSEASGESAAPVFREICEGLYRIDRRPAG